MANKRNALRFIHFLVWILFSVVISAAQSSGEVPDSKSAGYLVDSVNMAISSIATESNYSTINLDVETTTEEISTLITKLTSSQENLTTDQSSTIRVYDTSFTNKLYSTTSTARTTRKEETEETTTLNEYTTKEESNEEKTDLLTKLNGYKIATFCLAAILGIIFLIILIYFSAKSKTGHGDITCPPDTPPVDPEDYQKDEEPQVVRLSSYFPYADTLPRDELYENGDVDERRVTTFQTKKMKSPENATGSQDKILCTSEL